MALALGFIGLYVVVVAGLAWAAARLVPRRWLGGRAPVFYTAAALLAVACLPVPIHGGFLLLGPEVARETWAEWRRSRATAAEAQREQAADARFAGWLAAEAIGDGWRDPATGLVWSPAIWRTSEITPEALAEGRRRCAARVPASYWALPRNAEFFWLARTDRAEGAWLADAFLWPDGLSLPTRVTFARRRALPADATPDQRGGPDGTDVRCVAVTPPAPVRGYRAADIPLAEWNAFQLRLTGSPTR